MTSARSVSYSRVLLKLSGEALMGDQQFGISASVLGTLSDQIVEVHELGAEVALVIGGGNFIRGETATREGTDRVTGDHMGMLATLINSLALQDALEQRGVATRVLSALEIRQVAEPFLLRRALRHLEKRRIVIFAAGTGNPYFTTDSAAALRAMEIKAEVLLKATKVDGIYTADPRQDSQAKLLKKVGYLEALERRLKVMDTTAISLCMEHHLPIVVFDIFRPGNIRRVICGEDVGSVISE